MKKILFRCIFIFIFFGEILSLILFSFSTPDFSQDTIAVNEVLQSVAQDFQNMKYHQNHTELEYVVLDQHEIVLYRTKSGLSENVHTAISHRDTILNVEQENQIVGKIIIYNSQAELFMREKQKTILIFSLAIFLQFLLCLFHDIIIHHRILTPFRKLKSFAERVAGGNLDIPLDMDRYNFFGAFTESFDIMRSELKKARSKEAEAQKSKRELVAKLSHDIKTPVSSIKAIAEVGCATSKEDKQRERYEQIIGKSDQINTLITNLFTATLEELQELSVVPGPMDSSKIAGFLRNADYLHRAKIPPIPECLVHADPVRLQQVFDNIFANSYKYANTDISLSIIKQENYLQILVEDFGGGVKEEELAVIKEKYKRGSNVDQIEGAGLGLFISDYFMKAMLGDLTVENGANGLRITISIGLSGKI